MVAGTIIGASIFVQPSEIARHLETPGQIMVVWAACGLLTLAGAMVCAELASAFPQTGGVYVFVRDSFSPLAGFLWGWAMFWSMHSGIIAAIAMVFARYASLFVPVGDPGVRAIALLLILTLSAINYVRRRRTGYKPEYRTWGYPVVPAAFILVSLTIVVNQFASDPREAAVGLGLVLLGVPVYYYLHYANH